MANEVAGTWGTVSFQLPDFLEDVREAINSVAELLITFLDIALAALQLIKAFAIAFLDPIAAIVQAIIDTINGLLEDFRQLGLYITGDWGLLEYPFEDLRGGFSEYERRMIARLSDRSDPTRPDVSSNTGVLAAFFYLSVDLSNIERLVAFVQTLIRLFNLSFAPVSGPPVPVVTKVQYGSATTGAFGALENLIRFETTPPDKVRISWKAQPATVRHPFNPIPPLPPGGFLITVSTLPDGIPLVFQRVQGDTEKKDGQSGSPQQPREYGPVRDLNGAPIRLHGGSAMVRLSKYGFNTAVTGKGRLRDGVPQVYGLASEASNSVIAPEMLGPSAVGTPGDGLGAQHYLQRTFRVGSVITGAQWVTDEFSTVLDLKDMPHHAEFEVGSDGKLKVVDRGLADTYYVRIASSPAEIANGAKAFRYDLDSSQSYWQPGRPFVAPMEGTGVSPVSISALSQPTKVSFPNAFTNDFLDSVATALMVLALSRPDLAVEEELRLTKAAEELDGKQALSEVARAETGLERFKSLLDNMYPPTGSDSGYRAVFQKKGQDPVAWRRDLYQRCTALAKQLHDDIGSRADIQKLVVDQTPKLRSTRWSDVLAASGEVGITGAHMLDMDYLLLDAINPDGKVINALARIDAAQAEAEAAAAEAAAQEGGDPNYELIPTEASAARIAVKRRPTFQPFDTPPPTATHELGLAPNLYSVGVPIEDADELFQVQGAIRLREPDFFTTDLVADETIQPTIAADQAALVLAEASPALRMFYERYIQADGSIVLPTEVVVYLDQTRANKAVRGSADLSPVFFADPKALRAAEPGDTLVSEAGVLFVRNLFRGYEGGVLFQEAAIALSLAGAARKRPPQDGEWIAIRFFDMIPSLEGFFDTIQQWLDAIAAAIESIADAIIAYIEFVEARLAELQELIRRINAMIQAILSFAIGLPACSGLLLASRGTDGVMSDLVTAQNKPSDSPLAYGAGIAVLFPSVPAFVLDLFQMQEGEPDPTGSTPVVGAGPAFGIENLPAGAGQVPDPEPDVL